MTVEGGSTELIDGIRDHLEDISNFRKQYKIDFNAISFNGFGPSQDAMDMVAVDGSFTFLLNISSMWLGVVRAVALRYSCKDNGFQLVGSESVDIPVTISTWKSIVNAQTERHRQIFEAEGHKAQAHKAMMNEFRFCIEGEIALLASKRNKNCVIAIDGALVSYNPDLDWMKAVKRECEKNDNILIGVSKDSHTHAFNNPRRDEEIFKIGNGIAYVRVPSHFENKHRGTLYGAIYFAKFHKQAPKWFRVDIGTHRHEPGFVLSNVAAYSNSGLCLGYPYPLLEAHRFAVTVRQFKTVLEDMMFDLAEECNLSARDVLDGLTFTEGDRKSAFHEYLDRVSRDLK